MTTIYNPEQMNLEKLNGLLGTIANFGVIAGLVFVVIELNQNTNIAEVNAYQTLITQVNEINQLRATDEELAALDIKAELGEELSPVELSQYESFYRLATRHADMAFLQFQKRLISEDQLYGVLGPLRNHLGRDIGKEFWASERERNFVPGLADYINAMMAEIEPDSDIWKK